MMNEVGEVTQPEQISMMMFGLSENEHLTRRNNLTFALICGIIVLMLFVMRFAFFDYLPSLSDILNSSLVSILSVIVVFIFVDLFNQTVIKHTFKAVFMLISILISVVLFFGAFL